MVALPWQQENDMSDNRMLEDAELDAVSGGLDRPLLPVIIRTINKALGTNFPGGQSDPLPANCHPK